MLEARAALKAEPASAPTVNAVDAVRTVAARDLPALVRKIDADGYYPEGVMRALGQAGAYAQHLPGLTAKAIDVGAAIEAMAAVGEHCLSTAFCMWCQNALGWYIFASANEPLKADLGRRVARGEALGGTALSNPMKTLFGIETIRLKGRRADGGYVVKGGLPFVSNLGADHYFGAIFEVENPKRYAMAIVPCTADGVTLSDSTKFVALDGTRTFGVQMRDVFIPDSHLIADPVDDYVKRIRAGFVLLQAGMAIGLVRDCVGLMEKMKEPLGHVNKYLDVQPEALAGRLQKLEQSAAELAVTPFESDPSYWRAVIEARLAASELSLAAAQAAMLHCGARGYVASAKAQRRLRESYFVAIVTPATKQLKKMLADLAH
jgi:alkylation response protein AidB-like acyl-CoA dehydrogenase